MTLKEELAVKRDELAELKAAVESGEDKADELEQAIDAYKGIETQIKAADEASALLKSFKAEPKAEKTVRTLGDFAAKNLDLSAIRSGMSKSAGTNFGYKTYTDPQISQQMLTTSEIVADTAVRDTAIRDLFGAESISGNALKYFILGAKEDNSAPSPKAVNEGAAKPQFHIVESSATVTLQKIAGWFYETDELLEDNAFLKSALDNRGLAELDAAVASYLVTTLLSTSGIGTATYTHGGNVSADDIFKAMMTIKSASNLDADAIVINPADYQILRLAKDSATQYYGGGYFYGPFGNGELATQPGIWGLNTVISNAITSGTILVGSFRRAASVITKVGEGARIEVVTGDHDDAIYNRVTVVVEERLGLAARIPAGFVKITEAAS